MKLINATYFNGWNINYHATGWLWQMKKPAVCCPDCGTYKVATSGNYIKGGKRHTCLNPDCKRVIFIPR